MNIFALRGRGDSGKSTSIRLLHGLFIQNGYQVVSTTFNQKGGDFKTVFTKNTKRIGITSSGDTFDLVHNNLEALINDGCTLCVCACRTYDRYGSGTNAAIDTFLPPYQKQYVDKTIAAIPSMELATNQSDARQLFNTVDALV